MARRRILQGTKFLDRNILCYYFNCGRQRTCPAMDPFNCLQDCATCTRLKQDDKFPSPQHPGMGNSPSKDELSTSSKGGASASAALATQSAEVDADEPPLSLLPCPVPTEGISRTRPRRRSTNRNSDVNNVDEIGVSMARLLLQGLPRTHVASLLESKGSPVFTSSNDDSLSSVSSFGQELDTDGDEKALPPIVEEVFEDRFEMSETKIQKKVGFGSKEKVRPGVSPSGQGSLGSLGSSLSTRPFNIDSIIDSLIACGLKPPKRKINKLPVSNNEVKLILLKARAIFLEQPTLLRLSPPVKVVGDIHGQFHDLIRIFNACGYPPYTNYLFLGDYVDRGRQSLETFLLLLCYKIKYPENFFMLRGNHELANITKIYGFYDECKRRLGNAKIWKEFVDVFNTLPIAATINDKIFCIHGGLSPELTLLKMIELIKRPTDVPDRGLLADLLWLDPDPLVKSFSISEWPRNDRGVLYTFGRKHVEYFCNKFDIDLIVRGHMVVEDGYEFFSKRKLVTIFLAPNYCGEFDNFGAVMSVDKKLCCLFELLKPT